MKNYIIDNISICGFSHIRVNKECQDSSLSWKTDSYAAVIVCDGHGGEKYIRSADGSAIACEMGKRTIDEFMQSIYTKKMLSNAYSSDLNVGNYDKLLSQLERAIIHRWNEEVIHNYTDLPLENDERWKALSDSDKKALQRSPVKAYGTTFIASVLTKDFCFIIKLGDGNANLILNNKAVFSPEELADDTLQFNVTTSMCNSDADVMFRHYFCEIADDSENTVVGVLLSSDGVINCYRTEEAYHSFIENVYYAYGEDSVENAKAELIGVLNVLSERGSGDDLSIAIIRGEMTEEEKSQLKTKREQEEIERQKRLIEKEKAEAEKLRLEAEQKLAEAEKEKQESEKAKLESEKENKVKEAELRAKEAELKAKEAELDKKQIDLQKKVDQSNNAPFFVQTVQHVRYEDKWDLPDVFSDICKETKDFFSDIFPNRKK